MDYLVHPTSILERATSIEGFMDVVLKHKIAISTLMSNARNVAEEWTLDWDDEHGFGSSDGTFLVKNFIDNIICGKGYKTTFNPYLSVIEASPSRELKIKVLEGLTSVPRTESFKPRQSLSDEKFVLEYLLKELKTSDE